MATNFYWKFLVLFYIIAFGLWGFLLKVVIGKIGWKTTLFYVWIALSLINFIFVLRYVDFGITRFHLLAFLAGIIASVGTIAFYKALSLAPASLIIPLSAQYILVTTFLCILLLKEPISLRLILGIIFSIIAIVLLSR